MNNDRGREVKRRRETRETAIELRLSLAGDGGEIKTGIGFFDHMIEALALHAGWKLQLAADGDLQVDDHHTVEDCAIVLGQAIDELLGERRGIVRFGYAYAPLDESLSRAVVDLAPRAGAYLHLPLQRDKVGGLSCENVGHFFSTLAANARLTLHLDVLRGENDHHRIESAFKAFALAFRQAAAASVDTGAASTKGVL